ncbi:MAG: cytochrome P460 family protein [Terracidiphilus sp.]
MCLNSRTTIVLAALAAALPFLIHFAPTAKAAADSAPAYAANGDLLPIGDYREWIYLSTGLGMSYNAKPADMEMFDNVFVDPAAYQSFLATSTWPDKTMFVLEIREAKSKGSVNQHGHFQGEGMMGMEVHVKDTARFPGGWAFFSFDSPGKNGTLIPQGAPCYSCHQAHGAVDTTFVQFYPTLLPIAREKKTLSPAYLSDEAAAQAK